MQYMCQCIHEVVDAAHLYASIGLPCLLKLSARHTLFVPTWQKKVEIFSRDAEIPTRDSTFNLRLPPITLFCQIVKSFRLFDCGRSKAFPYAFFVVKEQLYA